MSRKSEYSAVPRRRSPRLSPSEGKTSLAAEESEPREYDCEYNRFWRVEPDGQKRPIARAQLPPGHPCRLPQCPDWTTPAPRLWNARAYPCRLARAVFATPTEYGAFVAMERRSSQAAPYPRSQRMERLGLLQTPPPPSFPPLPLEASAASPLSQRHVSFSPTLTRRWTFAREPEYR